MQRLRVSVQRLRVPVWEAQSVCRRGWKYLFRDSVSECLHRRLTVSAWEAQNVCVGGTEYLPRYSECLHGRIRVSVLEIHSASNDQPIFKVCEHTHCLLFLMLTLLPSKCNLTIMWGWSKSSCRCQLIRCPHVNQNSRHINIVKDIIYCLAIHWLNNLCDIFYLCWSPFLRHIMYCLVNCWLKNVCNIFVFVDHILSYVLHILLCEQFMNNYGFFVRILSHIACNEKW